MEKVLVITIIVACLVSFGIGNVQALSMSSLVTQLKMKLAEHEPDFPDSILQVLVRMSYNIVIPHGLSVKYYVSNLPMTPGVSTYRFNKTIFFASAALKTSGGEVRNLVEIKPKDLGRQELQTASPIQYFCAFRDTNIFCIYVYNTPTVTETLQIFYYASTYPNDDPEINAAYEEVVLNYALHLAYIRKGNWGLSAQVYTDFSRQLTTLRESLINRPTDVTVAPQEIE